MNPIILKCFIVILGLSLLNACGLPGARSVPDDHYYRLPAAETPETGKP